MKKILRYANLITLASGSLAMLLLFWLYAGGTNEWGLYPAHHAGWVLAGIVTTAFVVLAWFLAKYAGNNRSYRQNFPASIPAALGYAAAAVGLLLGGSEALYMRNVLGLLSGLMGLLGTVGMIWVALCRFRGIRCKLPVHMFPCFYFALQLFALGQQYGAEPEMCRYLYRFWATISMVPACYWLWSFDVKMGKRTSCLFWCLVAGYCNLAAVAGNGPRLMHICMAVWMLTALPRLRYLPKLPRTIPESAPVTPELPMEEASPAADVVEAEPAAEMPAAEEAAPHESEAQLPDPESILEQLLRDFGKQEET